MENKKNQFNIAMAVVVAAIIIGGAILLRGGKPSSPTPTKGENPSPSALQVKPISANDFVLGNRNAKVVLVEYADYQCPFCGKFFTETLTPLTKTYIETGKVALVYRDFAFLGSESEKSAEAARCANDQGKFWEYHDYLFTHQNGENQGSFADKNLKTFAKTLGLNEADFNSCLDSGKYTQAVKDATAEAGTAGINTTPYSFIMKDGKVLNEVKGAYPLSDVTAKIEAALK
jgi:protein-disulfide isomerase